jgi:hypothetical protein
VAIEVRLGSWTALSGNFQHCARKAGDSRRLGP